MAEERRIIFDEEEKELYKDIRGKEGPFKKVDLVDLFGIALLIGKNSGKRSDLVKDTSSGIRGTTLDATNIRYLMKAIAIDEENKIDVINGNCYKSEKDLENDKKAPFKCSRFDGDCYKKAKSLKSEEGIICDRYSFIAHQYAKTGIKILKKQYDEMGDDILDEMDVELLEFFDKNISV